MKVEDLPRPVTAKNLCKSKKPKSNTSKPLNNDTSRVFKRDEKLRRYTAEEELHCRSAMHAVCTIILLTN